MSKYALALVNIKGLGVKTYSYLIPDEMQGKIQIGQVILVPFGRQGLVNAFCVGHLKSKQKRLAGFWRKTLFLRLIT